MVQTGFVENLFSIPSYQNSHHTGVGLLVREIVNFDGYLCERATYSARISPY
mgnify:CR=1 FL=1